MGGYRHVSHNVDTNHFGVFGGKSKRTDLESQSYQGKVISESLPN
jgi:hypothetical protein